MAKQNEKDKARQGQPVAPQLSFVSQPRPEAVLTNLPIAQLGVPAVMAVAAVESSPDVPVAGLDAQLDSAIAEAREALSAYRRSTWRLASALLKLRDAYRARYLKDMPKAWLVEQLKLDISEQRVGQLLNTLAYYSDDGARTDEGVDFRVYEEARLANQRLPDAARLAPKELARLIQSERTGAAVGKAIDARQPKQPEPKQSEADQHRLVVNVNARKEGNEWRVEVESSFDGAPSPSGDAAWVRAAVVALRARVEEIESALPKGVAGE